MRRILLAVLGTLLLTLVFAESASAQRGWARGGGWSARAVGVRSVGFYRRPYLSRGWGVARFGWRGAGWGWRRPYVGYGWGSPWRRGWGWGAAGLVAGATAASYYGYGYPYGNGYGYSTYPYAGYGYSYGYPSCGCGSGYGYGGYGYPAAYSGWGY